MIPRALSLRIACGCLASLLFLLLFGPANALQLISQQEAGLPDDNEGGESRGISRRPQVVLINPAPDAGLIRSPFNLKMRFESFGGARIDPDSVVITYKKMPAIDLTQRVKAFLRPDGIQLENTQVPPGAHRIRVEVKDTEGRRGWAEFVLRISN